MTAQILDGKAAASQIKSELKVRVAALRERGITPGLGTLLVGEDPDGDSSDPRTFMRSVFRDGLLPAMRTDAVVLRAFFRGLNLLSTPDALAQDPDVSARVLAAWQDRDNRPPEVPLGPKHRVELLALLPA